MSSQDTDTDVHLAGLWDNHIDPPYSLILHTSRLMIDDPRRCQTKAGRTDGWMNGWMDACLIDTLIDRWMCEKDVSPHPSI